MRRALHISLLFILSVFFISCEKETPEAVVANYTQHWYKGELDAAKRYLVPDQRELVDKIASLRTAEELKKLKENKIEMEIQSMQQLTDSTIAVRCRVLINDNPQTNHYHLIKIKDRWYVDIY
ncbi:DUF4878 domain-containing protein [Bacteroidales bacterium OttesenSCG-928-E04]|nr:DUF4878 domain-containing protein [Bacteroidales bacterium OttesenSCG-928-E04]MDL2326551.1 DUF4878 domain-containing protein [Bacteroidales bacterium OttesenSCG-928-A14]